MPTSRKKILFKRKKQKKQKYQQLRGNALKLFKEKTKNLGKEFVIQLYERKIIRKKRKIRKTFVRVPVSSFKPDRYYQIYVQHQKTKQKRILGIGKFKEIPTRSHRLERTGKLLGGRSFDPKYKTAKKAIGKWIPTNRILASIIKEMEQHGKSLDVEVRGAIIPTKRYFHTDWLIFADKPLKGTTKVKKILVNCVIQLIYKKQNWIGKHSVLLEFARPHQIKSFLKIQSKLEQRVNMDLRFSHPKAEEIEVIEVNGFVPLGV